MRIYPLKFKKIYVPKEWGCKNIEKYNYSSEEKIGEVWLLSDNNPKSIIENGDLAGRDFAYLMDHFSKKILGEDRLNFPISIKYVISNDRQPIVVYLNSKTEILYNLKDNYISVVKENSLIDTSEILKIKNNSSELVNLMKSEELNCNTFSYIKSGMIHSKDRDFEAITVTDNTNAEYVLYNFNDEGNNESKQLFDIIDGKAKINNSHTSMFGSRFNIQEKIIEGRVIIEEDEYMHIFILIDGSMRIETNDDTFTNEKYEVMLIPSDLTGYEIIGYGKYLDIMLNRTI